MKQMCSENVSILRSEENYIADVNSKNPNESGIKYKAI